MQDPKKYDEFSSKLLEILNGSLRDKLKAYDTAIVPRHKAELILQSYKVDNVGPRLKPTTNPFNFNLPDTLKDYLEYRCSTTFSNMTKYLIDIIQNDMDNLPVGKETPLHELCETSPELAAKVIRFTIAQFERLGCAETIIVNRNNGNTFGVNKDGYATFDPYNDPYEALSKAIKSMAKNNESGSVFESVICHPSLEPLVRKSIENTPWSSAKVIPMLVDALLYNIIFTKRYRTEIFSLKKSNQLLNEEKNDGHGEYFYNQTALDQWMERREEKEAKAKERKYRIVENINAKGDSSFDIQGLSDSGTWEWMGESASTLEEAKKKAKSMKSESVVKKVIHEL